MSEPAEKDMQAAERWIRLALAQHPASPSLRGFLARVLAAAREEGRRAGLEEACKALCSKCRRGLVYQRLMGGENFGHFEQRGDVDHWAGNCDATAIRALLSSPAPTEPAPTTFGGLVQKAADEVKSWPEWKQRSAGVERPAPTTEPTRCPACDGIGAVNASEAAPMGEECPRCLGDGVAPSQEKP